MKRNDWINEQKTMDINKLVFLDETSINAGMTRLYGRALKGNRVNDYVPDMRFKRTSVLSSVRLDGTMVTIYFKGTLNGDLFTEYIKTVLAPTLKKGDVVIMDNLSSHKVSGVILPILEVGATVKYLPPYSPDLNPIELLWSKFKGYLKKVKARTFDSLADQILPALNSISKQDILHWFQHDGYSYL